MSYNFVYIIRRKQGGAIISVHWSLEGAMDRLRTEAAMDHFSSEADFIIDGFEVKR